MNDSLANKNEQKNEREINTNLKQAKLNERPKAQ